MKSRVPVDSNTHDWRFAQCFGDRSDLDTITESDIITSVEFDRSGDFLATGDKGGRIVLFQKRPAPSQSPSDERPPSISENPEYRFYTEFQSHDREFDYLKSLEIEEKINQIRWCHPTNNAHYLLSTNDKTIKLWKVFEKDIKVVAENNGTDRLGRRSFGPVPIDQLRLPKLNKHERMIASAPKKSYANAHSYHINSLSVNSDMETFLSSDDLRINLWNLNEPKQSFNIVDIRPQSMEELTEVITGVQCHPSKCNEFIYSTSKGAVRLADMRDRALCDQYSKCFVDPMEAESESFFTEITTSISDVKYAMQGRYIVARDFLSVKIWDVAMERAPVETIHVHDNIKPFLCTSYETDNIFDKFEVAVSGDGKSIMTGSYSSNFHIYPNALKPVEPVFSKRQRREVNLDDDEDFEEGMDDDEDMDEGMDTDSDSDIDIDIDSDEHVVSPTGLNAPSQFHDDSNFLSKQNSRSQSRSQPRSRSKTRSRSRSKYQSKSQPLMAPSLPKLGPLTPGLASTRTRRVRPGLLYDTNSQFEYDDRDVVTLTADKNVFDRTSLADRLRLNRSVEDKMDFRRSILHMSWHPYENIVAIATTNNLFMFNA